MIEKKKKGTSLFLKKQFAQRNIAANEVNEAFRRESSHSQIKIKNHAINSHFLKTTLLINSKMSFLLKKIDKTR